MKRVFSYVWKYKILVVIPSIAMLIAIALDMFNPYLQQVMIDKVISQKDLSLLSYVLIGCTLITLFRAVFGYLKEYLFDYLSAKINIDLKQDLFNHIQSLPFSYFDSMNTGELMGRIGEDVDNVWRTISFGLRLFVENVIYFVCATVLMFTLNWQLALVCFVIMFPIAYIAMQLEKKIGETYGKLSDQNALLNTTAQENIAGVRLVKAFAREKHEIMKFLKMNQKNYDLNMEQNNVFAKYFPLIEFLTNVAIVIMVILGGILVMKKNITVGTLVAFNGYIWMLIWPMRMLGWLTNMMAQNAASAKKIFNIMDIRPSIQEPEDAVHLSDVRGDISFDNVSFKYNEEYVLQDINLKVAAGSTVAIMGTTGSGKSTLVNLLGRGYDVAEGSISVDGYDVRELCLKDLRGKMAIVPQDTFLFSDTIEQNVRFGKENAALDEIESVCKTACAYEFISELEEGYETIIGERGIGLSGGQKQRISIARALIRSSSILILDDATSALDMETEYELLNNLKRRGKKATTFIIAHRISAVKNADQIIFMENGRIVEKGNHQSLLKQRGRYYDIYCEQFKEFNDMEGEVVV